MLRNKQDFRIGTADALALPEFRLLLIFLFPFLIIYLFIGFVCLPSREGTGFVLNHYMLPVVLAVAVSTLFVGLKSLRLGLIMSILCFFSVLFHFNFKSWALLSSVYFYDVDFFKLDKFFGFYLLARDLKNNAELFIGDLDFIYHGLFVLEFFLCFFVLFYSGGLVAVRRLNYGICLVLLSGGLLYWLVPALGPFVNEGWGGKILPAQQHMYELSKFIRINMRFPNGFFIEALGAMPSLHLAHATLFFLFVHKYFRKLSIFFLLGVIWFFIDSMATGWHYFVDIPPGILLGVFSYMAAEKIITEDSTTT